MEGIFQPMHMVLILAIALIIFGPGKLPELGEGLGKSIREFKKALKEGQDAPQIEHKEEKKTRSARLWEKRRTNKKTLLWRKPNVRTGSTLVLLQGY